MNRFRMRIAVALLLVCALPNISLGYSVLTHEAIIDSMWARDITPVLLKRFPGASADDLRQAHAYAFGGAIIQDMGYYPFGSRFYSDLTHYARSGEFVEALLRDATDINEYAFAVGALSHYCADNDGHTIATNVAVSVLYPKLRKQFGNTVTFEQKPSAHIQTEFGFDVLQVAQGHYAPQAYHDFIGFKVAKPLLERAFRETYGIELKSLFGDLDLALGTYRHTIGTLIPKLTRIAWQSTKHDMKSNSIAQKPSVVRDSMAMDAPVTVGAGTRARFLFNLSRADYSKEWGDQYKKPGFFSKVFAGLLDLLPRIGPLKAFSFKASTPETEMLFMRGFNATTATFRAMLVRLGDNALVLDNRDLDTGKPTSTREYGLADHAYVRLLRELAARTFTDVNPQLRTNILAFFRDSTMRPGTKRDSTAWRQALVNLGRLKAATLPPG
ncbi:MAG TPA: zinc dependent phospholipase C family protein [Gemmatimonadaceae bacterium]|nr:zinc dependent phospholipase C family protein [Gemmatimonadaceae bacterium]